MGTALIPRSLVPVARTDADWDFDIVFQEEDWTGAVVKVAFARQGLPAERFEIEAEAPTAELSCRLRLSADDLSDRPPGLYTAEVRRIAGDETDDAAVFEWRLVHGVSDLDANRSAPQPIGDATAQGAVLISRQTVAVVVRAAGRAGIDGDDGHTPTDEELQALIAPMIAPYETALAELTARVAALETGGGVQPPDGFVFRTFGGQPLALNGIQIIQKEA